MIVYKMNIENSDKLFVAIKIFAEAIIVCVLIYLKRTFLSTFDISKSN